MPDRAHKIAARQAELARKKHRHHEQQAVQELAEAPKELTNTASGQTEHMVTSSSTQDAEAGSKPSLLSSMRKVSSQHGSSPYIANRTMRDQGSTQADYFVSDLRRILLLVLLIIVILIALNFVIK